MALKNCKECGNKVSTMAKSCPKCGAVLKKKTSGCTGCLAVCILGFIVLAVVGSLTDTDTNTGSHSFAPSSTSSKAAKEWYEGGTLHNKSALKWQTASTADKLATCADFVTKMWQNGDLKPSISDNISTVDDVRPYAQELVEFLDAAFKPDPDPEQNRRLFTNQTVSSTAAIGMVLMEWPK